MSALPVPRDAGRGAPAWASFHLFLPGRLDPFLAGRLADGVEEERARGRIHRFFFIRYSEGGLHLRLRFLPAARVGAGALRERVAEWAAEHVAAQGGDVREVRVEPRPYDRAALYFGETRDSVYAELLNEATSSLSLRLLRAPGMEHPGRRWLAAGATLRLLVERAAEGRADRRGWMEESREFARRAGRALGSEAPARSGEAAAAGLRASLPRVAAALAEDADARRIPRLLRRARRAAGGGRTVGVHALHLLCNKLGLTLEDEDEIFDALLRLEAADE